MDTKIAKEVIGAIRTEKQRRSDRLKDEDPDVAYDQWLFTDEPFINEMCLMVLVALRHQVERELVFLAARANAGTTITVQQYQQNVKNQREALRRKDGWEKMVAKLNLGSFAKWNNSMETLRLLANCLKHEPTQKPDEQLLKHLKLRPVNELESPIGGYMPLPESSAFREGLVASVNRDLPKGLNLPKDADYCAIADSFVDLANQFLENVRQNTSLAPIPFRRGAEYGC